MDIEVNQLIYGITIFVGKMPVELKYGKFMSYTFQNLINKSYIIVLISENTNWDNPIYTRVHSSCVTSETLSSMDCDCVEQMNHALSIIGKNGGMFFYLIQEGRGCGYIGKSRSCMMVQANPNHLDTFKAYDKLGMVKDYRQYSCLKDILTMLEIKPRFILLTNNPDKITGFKEVGLTIHSTQKIEIQPNPFNIDYLISKRKSGHILHKTGDTKSIQPDNVVAPFKPYILNKNLRFIHVSSYYLPLADIGNTILIVESDLIRDKPYRKHGKYYLINLDDYPKNIKKKIPFWFKVSVFYDFVNQNEFVVLDYHTIEQDSMVLRIHSESIFNRFPLKEQTYKQVYQKSLYHIISHGYGKLILFYQDGRGFGLGNFIINKNIIKEENKRDIRDYEAVGLLLNNIEEHKSLIVCYSCELSKKLTENALLEKKLAIKNFLFVGKGNMESGLLSINNRVNNSIKLLDQVISWKKKDFQLDANKSIIVCGIGSSYSHAKYISYLLRNYTKINSRVLTISELLKDNILDEEIIILISQGLSPHAKQCIDKFGSERTKLITSYENNYKPKFIELSTNCERDTLIRISGPLEGYVKGIQLVSNLLGKNICSNIDISHLNYIKSFYRGLNQPSEKFTTCLKKNRSLILVVSSPLIHFIDNIRMKFVEGLGLDNCIVVDSYEIAHGLYQTMEYNRNNGKDYSVIIFNSIENNQLEKIETCLSNYNIWKINSKLSESLKIIEYEIIINYYIVNLLDRLKINQKNWKGKESQEIIYK